MQSQVSVLIYTNHALPSERQLQISKAVASYLIKNEGLERGSTVTFRRVSTSRIESECMFRRKRLHCDIDTDPRASEQVLIACHQNDPWAQMVQGRQISVRIIACLEIAPQCFHGKEEVRGRDIIAYENNDGFHSEAVKSALVNGMAYFDLNE